MTNNTETIERLKQEKADYYLLAVELKKQWRDGEESLIKVKELLHRLVDNYDFKSIIETAKTGESISENGRHRLNEYTHWMREIRVVETKINNPDYEYRGSGFMTTGIYDK